MPVDFETIYATDLVYVPDCWRLCGDAHCCSFARHKARFRLIGSGGGQELPLLPGEYAFLRDRGWLAQFQDHEHRAYDYVYPGGVLRVETILSRRAGCACDHGTRPTICRLYPLVPVYDPDGAVVSVHHGGVYEALERQAGLDPACRLEAIPFPELQKFLAVAAAIARDPAALFHVSAYLVALRHLEARLAALRGDASADVFRLFESNLLTGRLLDHDRLREDLGRLARRFEDRYGAVLAA